MHIRTGGEYFHECLIGICEEASARDYDIMITDVTGNDYSGVDRLIRKNKIDGVILTRTMEHDRTIQNLAAMQFPVAVTGSVDNDFVIHVDVDNEACVRRSDYVSDFKRISSLCNRA